MIKRKPKGSKAKTSGPKIVDVVTGATSGIGVKLVKKLVEEGHEVRVIIRQTSVENGSLLKMPRGVIPFICDITFPTEMDSKIMADACKGVDNVFHISGAAYNSKFSFDELVNANVVGTENVLNSVVKASHNDKGREVKFILVSSVTVYGYVRKGEKLTEESELNPKSYYSESKVMAEQVTKDICDANKNISYTILRSGIFYGVGYKKSFYKIFSLIHDRKAFYVGDGENHLILISEDDMVEGMLLASESNNSNNKIYNISDGNNYTVKSLFNFVAKELGVEPPEHKVPKALANLGRKIMNLNIDEFDFIASDRVLDISKIENETNFKPKYSIYDNGKELIDLYKEEVLKSDLNVKDRKS